MRKIVFFAVCACLFATAGFADPEPKSYKGLVIESATHFVAFDLVPGEWKECRTDNDSEYYRLTKCLVVEGGALSVGGKVFKLEEARFIKSLKNNLDEYIYFGDLDGLDFQVSILVYGNENVTSGYLTVGHFVKHQLVIKE